tara:strand:- start:218 stop:676 length:459 start_codon:yes stop_codon:yes gene_type:complete
MAEKKLPFPLCKRHKSKTFWTWEKNGVIFESEEHREEIYLRYIYSTNCELCGNEYISSKNRHLEHEHDPTKPNFRNIVCTKCNRTKKDRKSNNNTDENYISKCKDKYYKQGFCFRIQIIRDGKYVLNIKRKTLEEAIIARDKFIKEHPEIYP